MFTTQQGYIFDARLDASGNIGILEGFKCFGGTVDIVFGISQVGDITKAIYCDKSEGFQLLSKIANTDESLTHFLRSKRGTYAVIGNSAMIGVAKLRQSTREIKSLELYAPVVESNCEGKPCLICNRLSANKGFHVTLLKEGMYNSIKERVAENISRLDYSDKKSYLQGRL